MTSGPPVDMLLLLATKGDAMPKTVGLFDSIEDGDRFSGEVAGQQVCGKVTRITPDNTIEVADEFTGRKVCISVEARFQL